MKFLGTAIAASAVTLGVTNYLPGTTGVEKVYYVNLPPGISGTGTTSTQVNYLKYAKKALTATGGLTNYRTLYWPWPETYSGALIDFCIDTDTGPTDGSLSVQCVVNKTTSTGTGTATNALIGSATVKHVLANDSVRCSHTGSIFMGKNYAITCTGLTGSGEGLIGTAHMEYREALVQ
jgi:hypothetical protein